VLVCPNCRSENVEGSSACQVCGRSLSPGDAPLRRVERPEVSERPQDELDVPPPRPTSRWRAVAVAAVLVLAVAGAGIWYSGRPEVCDGKFVSNLYPYCVTVPAGWTAATTRTPTGALDRFEPDTDGAAIVVRAGEAVPGTTTTQYAQGIRQTQEAFGVTLGPVQTLEVGDGTQAFGWQAVVQLDDGSILQQRMVALVRNGVGWRITLGGDSESFDEARFAFEELLATWDWNDTP
jgi:hypothetical protein